MLEIILIVAVAKAFVRKAEEKGLHRNLWGLIGVASYYSPILLMSFVVMPYLISTGMLSVNDHADYFFYSILLNLGFGGLGCLIAFQILNNQKINIDEPNTDILDSDLDDF